MPGRAQRSDALVLRSVEFRDADRIVTFLTRDFGQLGALARGARRSQKRFGGVLEPFSMLEIEVQPGRGSLHHLREAQLRRPFPGVLRSLEAMREAGSAFELIRRSVAENQPEPGIFDDALSLLEELDQGRPARSAALAFKVRLLHRSGVWPQLDRCVRCGRAVPQGRAALVDPAGGATCRACGGAAFYLPGEVRQRLLGLISEELEPGEQPWRSDQLDEAQALVEAVASRFVGSG